MQSPLWQGIATGRFVVRDGTITTLEPPVPVERHNRLAAQLAQAAHARR